MFDNLPQDARDALDWEAGQYTPYLQDLINRDLTAATIDGWLLDWSKVGRLLYETFSRINVATTVDTTDEVAKNRHKKFMNDVFPVMMTFNHQLNHKLVESGLKPDNFEVPLQKIAAEIAIFREENLPLMSQESDLGLRYDEIVGAQTVEWEGEEVTLARLLPIAQDPDRAKREQAWYFQMNRWLQDRDALNAVWGEFMALRGKMAANADLPDYRAYAWKRMNRFDYTPQDSMAFHDAIEQVVVPASARVYEKIKARLKVDPLRPWDIGGDPQRTGPDPFNRPQLRPYQTIDALESGLETVFQRVDPELGAYFSTMRREKLLDLDNRKGKAPGGYCTDFPMSKRPFIFMNAVGIHDDVQTLLHEGGHAFHAFESFPLPYMQQQDYPMEFAEVASMAMELLAAPYLADDEAGLYNEAEAARARVEHLESALRFWPYMAVVDAFQHWVYTNHAAATDPTNCDAKWAELWDRFIPVVNYVGLEDVKATGWHRKLHIFQIPFYYVEYGLAQLGAVQVWANALQDQAAAVRQYRGALALGCTRSLPELYAAAGAKLAFDADTLKRAVDLIETTIDKLDVL